MDLFFSSTVTKNDVFAAIRKELGQNNFTIINNEIRLWGAFLL